MVPEINAQCSVSKAEFKLQDIILLQKTYPLKKRFSSNTIKKVSRSPYEFILCMEWCKLLFFVT
jgi:hypothetical protein